MKLLEHAIATVRALPDADQEAVAAVMLVMAGAQAPVVQLDDETRAAIAEGIAQAERGEFVPDDVIAAADQRHGVCRSATRCAPSRTARRSSNTSKG